MDAIDHFTIPLSGLRDGLHRFDYEIGKEFFEAFDHSPLSSGEVNVHLEFEKRLDLCIMTFSIDGKVEVTCDRCLDPFDLPIEDEQRLLVKYSEEVWEDADVIYILYDTETLNVARYIYEFINLAVPMIKHHDDAGERCNPEMLKYLSDKQDMPDEAQKNNPFRDALEGFNFEN